MKVRLKSSKYNENQRAKIIFRNIIILSLHWEKRDS